MIYNYVADEDAFSCHVLKFNNARQVKNFMHDYLINSCSSCDSSAH